MSYCINPNCSIRQNPDSVEFCLACGNRLLINDRYWLVRPLRDLQESQNSEVFEADDQGTRKVLKFLKSNGSHYKELFEQEAKILINLRHSGIPKAELSESFTFRLENGRTLPCLVMEKIEGQNLLLWLQENGPISQDLALQWLRELAEILGYVHQQGFFHRDIKPSNIMLKPDGQLVLIDFGTAREVTQTVIDGQEVTAVYSHGYTAPEQTEYRAVPQSDFFALGRTFVHLLTGLPPHKFPQDSQSRQLIWRDSARQVSRLLVNFIDELMAPFVQNRPQNMQIIWRRIEEIERHLHRRITYHRWDVIFIFLVSVSLGLSIERFLLSGSTPQPCDSLSMESLCLKHEDDVNAVAFSPNREYLATASLDSKAQMWQVSSGKPVKILRHNNSAVAVTFSPKTGKYLVTASLDGTAQVWDINNGSIKILGEIGEGSIIEVAFSPSEQYLAIANANGTGQLWNLNNYQVRSLEHNGAFIRAVAFSPPDGKYLATTSADGKVRVWNVSSGKLVGIPLPHDGGVLAVAFSPPDGKYLATASADGKVRVWDVFKGELFGIPMQHNDNVVDVAYSPNGKYLATFSSDNTLRVWDNTSLRRTAIANLQKPDVRAFAFSPKWNYLAAATANDIHVWELDWKKRSYKNEVACLKHNDRVAAIAFSKDEEYIATASWDNTTRLIRRQKCSR